MRLYLQKPLLQYNCNYPYSHNWDHYNMSEWISANEIIIFLTILLFLCMCVCVCVFVCEMSKCGDTLHLENITDAWCVSSLYACIHCVSMHFRWKPENTDGVPCLQPVHRGLASLGTHGSATGKSVPSVLVLPDSAQQTHGNWQLECANVRDCTVSVMNMMIQDKKWNLRLLTLAHKLFLI